MIALVELIQYINGINTDSGLAKFQKQHPNQTVSIETRQQQQAHFRELLAYIDIYPNASNTLQRNFLQSKLVECLQTGCQQFFGSTYARLLTKLQQNISLLHKQRRYIDYKEFQHFDCSYKHGSLTMYRLLMTVNAETNVAGNKTEPAWRKSVTGSLKNLSKFFVSRQQQFEDSKSETKPSPKSK